LSQFGWNRQISPASSGIVYNGGPARIIITEPGTYNIECSLAAQVEQTTAPYDFCTLIGIHPAFSDPTPDIIFQVHIFSSGSDSVTVHSAVRTIVVSQAMLDADPLNQYTMEFAIVLNDVPPSNILTILQELTNFRITKVCDATPFPLFKIADFPQPI
jgi:hypothetical protein